MTRFPAFPETSLDLRGLRCPIPVIRLEAAMRRMKPGGTLAVTADDPLARIDLPHAARSAGMTCEAIACPDSTSFAFRITAPGQ
jgi:tRNA 2-thiouridine synthesizing protein A